MGPDDPGLFSDNFFNNVMIQNVRFHNLIFQFYSIYIDYSVHIYYTILFIILYLW